MKNEQDWKRIETERLIGLPESERKHNNHGLSKSLDKKPVYPMVVLRRLTADEIRTHISDMYGTEQQKSTATKKRKIPLEKDLNPKKKLNNNLAKIAIISDSE